FAEEIRRPTRFNSFQKPEENESQDILVEESYDEPPDESQTESDEECDSEVSWKAMEEEAEENDYGNDEELNRATQNTISVPPNVKCQDEPKFIVFYGTKDKPTV
ncbi:Hypothetical predicted protein, partial [Paramuricea clavata]